jgi:hypothetical protein
MLPKFPILTPAFIYFSRRIVGSALHQAGLIVTWSLEFPRRVALKESLVRAVE